MSPYWILVVILLPMITGALLPILDFKEEEDRGKRQLFVAIPVILNTILVYALILHKPVGDLTLVHLTKDLSISFQMDGLSAVFAGLVAGLWPLSTCYAFEYIRHEGKENKFFAFYTMTYGVTLGIALSANVVTMYLFYELLTLATVPLVMHAMDKRSIRAGLKYLAYSIGGAAIAFTGVMILMNSGDPSMTFYYGGSVTESAYLANPTLVQVGYLLCFFGFGVKAAIFPFHEWLPAVSVAPTPVTALLHAVAVVKAGAFAILRITFYSFGPGILLGTPAQGIAMAFAMITIVFGSVMALKEQHFKRRLAYSTVSNLSYIIFGATLMTPYGFLGALCHMLFHGIMKITLFFCAGSVLVQTGREYVHELEGLGKKMKLTFFAFTVGSLALVGLPLLCGFISKWKLGTAAASAGTTFAFVGILALLISAVLTCGYTMPIVIRAYLPREGLDESQNETAKDPGLYMTVPVLILCAAMLYFGMHSGPICDALFAVAAGLI